MPDWPDQRRVPHRGTRAGWRAVGKPRTQLRRLLVTAGAPRRLTGTPDWPDQRRVPHRGTRGLAIRRRTALPVASCVKDPWLICAAPNTSSARAWHVTISGCAGLVAAP